jgi:hypothetical protein
MSTNRRLAAILAVDVAGYSRLMGEDEAGTAQAVREHRQGCAVDRDGRILGQTLSADHFQKNVYLVRHIFRQSRSRNER